MRIPLALLSLFIFNLPVFAQAPRAAVTGDRQFKSPAATAAQHRYFETLKQARQTYAADLEPGVKAALAAGSLDEANAINELKKLLESGGMPHPGQTFKTTRVNEARAKFEKAVAAGQRQYAADLQGALKTVMAAGDLNEANAINAELKGLAAVAVTLPVAAATSTPPPLGAATAGRSAAGLLLTRYPMHPSQKSGNRAAGYVPYTDLGTPLGVPKTVRTVSGWRKDIDENAVVSGLIRIDQPGKYEFRTSSGWDRNELLIDGKIVCKFKDGEDKVASVDLRPGLLPIVSVGYALETTVVRVQWKPPGAADFSELPSNLFSH